MWEIFPALQWRKKKALSKKRPDATVVDLPGIYSLSPYTSEEIVTRDFVLNEHPNGIINIVDATNIERNLYLSLQLIELGIPMVVALNMMDEVRASGNSIDVQKLSDQLGVPVVPISAGKNEGINDLIDVAIKVASEKRTPQKYDFCEGEVHKAIHAIAHIVVDQAAEAGLPLRFAATKLVEGDEPTQKLLNLDEDQKHIIEHIIEDMQNELGTDREAALADMRYTFIEKACAACVTKHQETREQVRSERIDRILTNKWLGIPIFLGIMLIIFWLTFTVLGEPLQNLLDQAIKAGTNALSDLMVSVGASYWIRSLIVNGVCAGVGSVLSFLPIMCAAVFLPLHAGRQRIYGKGRFCNG